MDIFVLELVTGVNAILGVYTTLPLAIAGASTAMPFVENGIMAPKQWQTNWEGPEDYSIFYVISRYLVDPIPD